LIAPDPTFWDSTKRPVAVTGLAAESRIAQEAGFATVVGAGDPARTRELVELAAGDSSCLVSFGIAGGLADGLPPGTVILTGEVLSARGHWVAEDGFRRQLSDLAAAIGAVEGRLFGANAVLASRWDKEQAWQATRALAVDLESGIVAEIASARGIPFIALRAIADDARCDLPPAALLPLTPSGRPEVLSVLAALLRRPGQIGGVIALGLATRRALAALIRPARALRRLVDPL
jgi:uridine phosphorylase